MTYIKANLVEPTHKSDVLYTTDMCQVVDNECMQIPDELIKCNHCGHTWDGNAQCQCTLDTHNDNEDTCVDTYQTQFDIDGDNSDSDDIHPIVNKLALIEQIREHVHKCPEETLLEIASLVMATQWT